MNMTINIKNSDPKINMIKKIKKTEIEKLNPKYVKTLALAK